MTIFELVKLALDELYKEGLAVHAEKLDQKIKEQIIYLSTSYSNLSRTDREPINYKDPSTRFAYVYKYVASHGDYVVQVLEKLRLYLEGPIFKSENIRVSCIGGGPGSDIIAVLKYLHERKSIEPVKKVTCYLLDREQAWADTWTEFGDSLGTELQLSTNFQPLDVTKPESWAQQTKFLEADLFTLSYFVSEVKSLDCEGVVTKFWQQLFKKSKSGALFLYDDNGNDDFNSYFDKQWKDAGLIYLITENDISMSPQYSEEKEVLGEFLTKFDQSPKLKSKLSYRVLKKP
jgi:hypothetical protein